jgi:chemotaxis protein methyltransferase CheR
MDAEVIGLQPAAPRQAAPDDDVFELEVRLLLDALLARYQHDFRGYSHASVHRRVRQAMHAFGCASVSELQGRVLRDAEMFARLLQFLTVHVSEMFRDPTYFRAVREQVVPMLRTFPSAKVWVAGCSTGEEAWSLAILLREEGLLEQTLIYATDIDPQALRQARAGVYPLDRIAGFSASYQQSGGTGSLADHYVANYRGAAFDRRLRANIVFAEHSLATDSVFSEVHFVSCRNVLIYFEQPLQDRAVGLFRDALVRRGFLGLGSRESLRFCAHHDAFEEVVGAGRLYRKAVNQW